jgi:hypothetical protein
MPSREQRRAERRKRKARGAQRRAEITARYEQRNREAREKLEPLGAGERPTVVTISAVIAAVLAIAWPVVYLILLAVGGDRPPVITVIWPAFLMGMAAYGMWRARYWAVLGFDVLLVFAMIGGTVSLIVASDAAHALAAAGVIAVSGTLFFFMVKAMARIQMPERRPPR